MAANPQLLVQQITDINIRKNFQNLSDYFALQNQLLNFNFLELNFAKAVTEQIVPHSLGVLPQDIIVTRITGPGQCSFLWGQFTDKNMFVTTTDACRVRFFYGSYYNFTSNVNNLTADQMTVSAT